MDTDSDADLLLTIDRSFHPPTQCLGVNRCRDFFHEFIYIVIVPAAVVVLILFVIIFVLLVCCCIRCRRKKTAAESEDQLAAYDAIRRASISVRRMSHSNTTTPLLESRSGSISLSRNDHRRRGYRPRDSCHSAPGTLQRHHRNRDSASYQDTPPPPPPPPPYGVPSQYPLADEEQAFLGPDIPLQDLNANDADVDQQRENGHHPPRPHRHHRRQRPYSAANGYMTR